MTSPEEPTRSELNKALDEACRIVTWYAGNPPKLVPFSDKITNDTDPRIAIKIRAKRWREYLLEKVREG